jgi:beta-lactam-binding protein with PASTA domain
MDRIRLTVCPLKIKNIMNKFTTYFVATLPFLCFVLGYIFSSFLMRSTVYQTPNLVGLKLSQALTIAAQNHATIKLLHEQECPGVPAETIISQKPTAGRLIKPNQAILITIAKETAPVLAPNFKLQKLSACQKSCTELGLKMKYYPIVYALPQETCIGQIPQEQEAVSDKKIILYTAEAKTNNYIMPNLLHKNLDDVIQLLSNQEINYTVFLEYEKIEPPYDKTLTITQQKPKAGSLIHVNKSLHVQLEVS